MWGALHPAGVVGAAGQGGVSLPSSGEGGGVMGGAPEKGLSRGWVSWVGFLGRGWQGPLCRGGCPLEGGGLWPPLQAQLAPLPPSERARLLPLPGLCLRSCSSPAWGRNSVPAGCPSGGSFPSPPAPPHLGSAAPSSVTSPPIRVCTRQRPHCPQSIGHRLQPSPRWLLSLCTHLAVNR